MPLAFAFGDSAHRFDIVFRESVSRRTMFLRIDEIIFRLREPTRYNIFANLRYKRPVNLLVTREFQQNDPPGGAVTSPCERVEIVVKIHVTIHGTLNLVYKL